MFHKIAGLPGTLAHSVTGNLILSVNSPELPITRNYIAVSSVQRDVINSVIQRITGLAIMRYINLLLTLTLTFSKLNMSNNATNFHFHSAL